MTAPLALGPLSARLAAAFPFHILLDRSLTIVHVSDALRNWSPTLRVGDPLVASTSLRLPFDADELLARRDGPPACRRFVVSGEAEPERAIRAQLLALPHGGLLVAVCTPELDGADSLPELIAASQGEPSLDVAFDAAPEPAEVASKRDEVKQPVERTAVEPLLALLDAAGREIAAPLERAARSARALLETPLSAWQHSYVSDLAAAVSLASGIALEANDLVRLELGAQPLASESFELRGVVEDAVAEVAQAAELKGLELAARVAPEAPHLTIGDRARVRQLLVILLRNAVRHTEHGHVLVEVERARDSRGGSGAAPGNAAQDTAPVTFTVHDTGAGMSAERLHQVLEGAASGDGASALPTASPAFGRPRAAHSGIGLALVHRIVRAMNGSLSATSQAGKGTTVRATLPLRALASASPDPSLAGLRILVLDERAVSGWVTLEQLTDAGARAAPASSVNRALAELARAARGGAPYDAVVCRARLADGDARSLASAVAAEPALSSTRIIALHAAGAMLPNAGARDTSQASACIEWLASPVRAHVLLTAVASAGRAAQRTGDQARGLDVPAAGTGSLAIRGAVRPLVSADARAGANASAGEAAVPDAERDSTAPRVLVVDDNAIARLVTGALLSAMGCTVAHASDGPSAIAAAARSSFDLILMDDEMPVMDGYESARRIRRGERAGRRVPIIGMSNAAHSRRERCLAAGMSDCLNKPADAGDLRAALASWCGWPHDDADAPRFDETVLARMSAQFGDGGDEYVSSLVRVFVTGASQKLDAMASRVTIGELDEICELAHAFSGAAETVAARPLVRLSHRLEHRARAGDREACRALLDSMANEIARATAASSDQTLWYPMRAASR